MCAMLYLDPPTVPLISDRCYGDPDANVGHRRREHGRCGRQAADPRGSSSTLNHLQGTRDLTCRLLLSRAIQRLLCAYAIKPHCDSVAENMSVWRWPLTAGDLSQIVLEPDPPAVHSCNPDYHETHATLLWGATLLPRTLL
jgi:hypothetical protein